MTRARRFGGRGIVTGLAALFSLLCASHAAPVLDGERDAEYTLVASSPKDNLLVDPANGISDPADPRAKSLDVTGLWAANTPTALYLYVELPYLDLHTIAGEWAVVFHLRGANDAIQRTGAVNDPYGASVDFGHSPAANVVLKSNMRGFLADYDGNQGWSFLNPTSKARDNWAWENSNFLASHGWVPDTASGVIRGLGYGGAGVVYANGRGIELRIPLPAFAPNPANTDMVAPSVGDEILMQFYGNVRERGTPRYPRGPIDCAPFESASRTNPARGTVSAWGAYRLAPSVEVTGAALKDPIDLGRLVVSFSSALGAGATTETNYEVTDLSTGETVPVGHVAIDGDRAILTLPMRFGTMLGIRVRNVKSVAGGTVAPPLNAAEVTVGSPIIFDLRDPYGAVSSLGNDPATGQPYKVVATGDPIGWRNDAHGATEIAVSPVPGEPGHYRSAPVISPTGVIAYKYRVPHLPNWDNWNALNPHDRRFFVPATQAPVETADNAAGSVGGTGHYGGPLQVTWTLEDRLNAANGRPVYVTGQFTGWSATPGVAVAMPPVPGRPGVYSATFTLPAGYGRDTSTMYKYIIKPTAGTTLWDELNPKGDRWAIFRATAGQAATVTDILGAEPRFLRVMRAAAGIEPSPMFSAYSAELDADGDGSVTLLDAVAVLRDQNAAPLPRLRTERGRVVDPGGNEFRLRGTNLGGWFVEEMWMTPWVQDPPSGSTYPKADDHFTLADILTRRLGADAASRVRTAWRNAWIQPSDFTRIRAAGLNGVRVPFIYDLLDEPGGMDWLRNAVSWANTAGLYVILDMHGAPGSQNPWDHSGRVGLDAFFKDEGNLTRAEEAWARLAQQFGGNPGVMAMDLLNEPVSAPDAATLHKWHNRLYQAVRRHAPETLVIIEDGYKGIGSFPHPSVYGWTDVIYSTHIYKFDATSSQDHLNQLASLMPEMLQLRDTAGVPVFVGEFNLEPHNSPDAMRQYVGTLTENGLAWTIWTWKTVARGGPMGFWGYYSRPTAANALNPFTDSEATLIGKTAQIRTENLTIPAGFAGVFR